MVWKRRLKIQFSLRFLLIAMVPFGWFTWQYVLSQKRASISEQLNSMGLYVYYLDTYSEEDYQVECTNVLFFETRPNSRTGDVIRPGFWGNLFGYGNQRELVVFTDAWLGSKDATAHGFSFDDYVPLLIKLPGLKRIVLCQTTLPEFRVDASDYVLSPDREDESQEFRRRIHAVRPDIEIGRITLGPRYDQIFKTFNQDRPIPLLYGPERKVSNDGVVTSNATGEKSKVFEPKTNSELDHVDVDPFGN